MEVVSIDSSLTHYSKTVQLITGIYCCIISKILSERLQNQYVDNNELINLIQKMIINEDPNVSIIIKWFNNALELNDL